MSVSCVWNNSLCSNLSATAQLTRLSQRDVQYRVSVDQVYAPGFDANRAVFDSQGYTSSSIRKVGRMVDLGFHSMFVDVWYDGVAHDWQLCPGAFPANASQSSVYNVTSLRDNSTVVCSPDATFGALMAEIREYLSGSDTDIAADVLLVNLRPRSIPASLGRNASRTVLPADSSLNLTLAATLGDRIFNPSDLMNARKDNDVTSSGTDRKDQSELWPSLHYVVLSLKKRLIMTYFRQNETIGNFNELSDLAFERPPLYPLNHSYTSSAHKLIELSNQGFRAVALANRSHLSDDWGAVRDSGLSPILNTTQTDQELIALMNSSSWLWAMNQPAIPETTGGNDNTLNSSRNACGMWTSEGFVAASCSRSLHCLCRNTSSDFHWTISDDRNMYYSADCPDGYEFSLPRSSLEAEYLHDLFSTNVWGDLNSLYIPNCWVDGGVLAICPYNVRQSDRNGVAFITVAAVASFCILCSMIYFEWDRVFSPVRRHSPRQPVTVKEGVAE